MDDNNGFGQTTREFEADGKRRHLSARNVALLLQQQGPKLCKCTMRLVSDVYDEPGDKV